jgi:SHS2 domain-containing protein
VKSSGNLSSLFRETNHTADYALLVRGEDTVQLFKNAAAGLTQLMGSQWLATNDTPTRRRVRLDGSDSEELLVSWLEELCFIAETEMLVLADCSFKSLTERELEADILLRPAAGLKRMIKAVTYHNLCIQQTPMGLQTTIVFDV